MREAGFAVSVNVLPDLRSLRSSHTMPDALASCHSGLVGGYFLEGHAQRKMFDVSSPIGQTPLA